MPFQKGQSGNPAGRPRGSRNKAAMALQDLLEHDAESIARTVTHLANDGNIAAIRMCMDRLCPPRKDRHVSFALPKLERAADAVNAAATIVDAVASGDLTPSEAGELSRVITAYATTLEAADFDARLRKLEAAKK